MVTLPNNNTIIFQINQVFLDIDLPQTEALLHPHQARSFGIILDGCDKIHLSSTGYLDGQCIIIINKKIDIHFDVWKCYLKLEKTYLHGFNKYDIHTLV